MLVTDAKRRLPYWREGGGKRKRLERITKKELRNFYYSSLRSIILWSNQGRWDRRAVCMGDKRNAHRILSENLKRRRNIKCPVVLTWYLKSTERYDQICQDWDWNQYWKHVIIFMKIIGSINGEKNTWVKLRVLLSLLHVIW